MKNLIKYLGIGALALSYCATPKHTEVRNKSELVLKCDDLHCDYVQADQELPKLRRDNDLIKPENENPTYTSPKELIEPGPRKNPFLQEGCKEDEDNCKPKLNIADTNLTPKPKRTYDFSPKPKHVEIYFDPDCYHCQKFLGYMEREGTESKFSDFTFDKKCVELPNFGKTGRCQEKFSQNGEENYNELTERCKQNPEDKYCGGTPGIFFEGKRISVTANELEKMLETSNKMPHKVQESVEQPDNRKPVDIYFDPTCSHCTKYLAMIKRENLEAQFPGFKFNRICIEPKDTEDGRCERFYHENGKSNYSKLARICEEINLVTIGEIMNCFGTPSVFVDGKNLPRGGKDIKKVLTGYAK